MNILFLANRVPYPPFRGDKLKIFNLARRLGGRHRLILLCFLEDKADILHRDALEKVFTEVHFVLQPRWRSIFNGLTGLWRDVPFQVLYFHSRAMQSAVNELCEREQFDAVHIQHLRMAPYLAEKTHLPRILDLPDAYSLYWKRRQELKGNPVRQWMERQEQHRVFRYERRMIPKFDMSLVCSVEDLAWLEENHGFRNLRLLPNGVDLDTFASTSHDYNLNRDILFSGNMDYAPNVDAVVYFKKEIFPIILAQLPDVRFVIAGQRPVPKVLALQDANTEVTGFVANMASMYQRAAVVVAPLRFGAGTQNKVLEALAMGVPVVCSHIGFAGLGIENGQGAFQVSEPKEFANVTLRLLNSAEERRQVGHQGSQLIRERFDWNVIAGQLEKYLICVAHNKR